MPAAWLNTDRSGGRPANAVRRVLALCVAAVACLLVPTGALAAPPASSFGGSAQDGSPRAGLLSIEAVRAGVGGRVRPGSWTGLLVEFANRGERELEVLLRLELPDADGDLARYERVVTANPGVRQSAWIYARVPHATSLAGARVSAYAATASENSATGFGAGALLDQAPALPPEATELSASVGLIGVLGRRGLGLSALENIPPDETGEHLAQGHERIEVLTRLDPAALPDRWMGLDGFSALVWADAAPERTPADSAAAVREWVARGGHLVVVLPAIGQSWLSRGANPLFDLLPSVTVDRSEDATYEPLRALLADRPGVDMPARATLHVLEPSPDAEPGAAVVVLRAPGGEPIVVRRRVGVGAVTLVGVDLLHPVLARESLPSVGAFWNRVLGRRGPADPAWRLAEIREENVLFQRLESLYLDDAIAGEIAQTGRAAAGVLLGIVVFAAYWAIAGPVGFYALRATRRSQHAWVVFLLCAGVFTGIAWTGAAALRPQNVNVSHLTVLTGVHGQGLQRARVWTSVLLPTYGSSEVTFGSAGGSFDVGGRPLELTQALSPWDARRAEASGGGFPDTRAYVIPARHPSAMRLPARQTVKQVRADWAGVTSWGGLPRSPTAADGSAGRLVLGDDEAAPWRVVGTLVHDLPSPMRDVRIVVNKGQTTAGGRDGTALAANAGAFALTGGWAPGQPLDLGVVTGRAGVDPASQRENRSAVEFLETLTPVAAGQGFGGVPQIGLERRLLASMLYPVLDPPELSSSGSPRQLVTLRAETHGLDLGRWLTVPCVIVLGFVEERDAASMPVPMLIDGAAPIASGLTLVAWVYPLPDAPPRVRERAGDPVFLPGGGE